MCDVERQIGDRSCSHHRHQDRWLAVENGRKDEPEEQPEAGEQAGESGHSPQTTEQDHGGGEQERHPHENAAPLPVEELILKVRVDVGAVAHDHPITGIEVGNGRHGENLVDEPVLVGPGGHDKAHLDAVLAWTRPDIDDLGLVCLSHNEVSQVARLRAVALPRPQHDQADHNKHRPGHGNDHEGTSADDEPGNVGEGIGGRKELIPVGLPSIRIGVSQITHKARAYRRHASDHGPYFGGVPPHHRPIAPTSRDIGCGPSGYRPWYCFSVLDVRPLENAGYLSVIGRLFGARSREYAPFHRLSR